MGTLPQISGPLPGPNARRIIERDGRILSSSYTRSYPLVVERGEGAIVIAQRVPTAAERASCWSGRRQENRTKRLEQVRTTVEGRRH